MKKIIISTCLIMVIVLGCLNICADEAQNLPNVDFDIETETFTITGKSLEKGVFPVSVNIYHINKDEDDLYSDSNSFAVMAYHNQLHTDKNGEYVINAAIDGVSGEYLCYIKIGKEERQDIVLKFTDREENKASVEVLNSLTLSQDITEYIAENIIKLGFDNTLYDEVSKDAVSEKILSERAENGIFDVNSPEETKKTFEKLVIAQALYESGANNILIDDVFEIDAVVSIISEDENGLKWYKQKIEQKPSSRKSVTARLYGKDAKTINELAENIVEALILEIIENPNGFGNVKSIIADFSEIIGIEKVSTSDEVYRKLAGGNYETLEKLKEAYDSYLSEIGNSKPSGGGSSGGGGGGGSSSKGSSEIKVENTVVNNNAEIEPVKKDVFSDIVSVPWAKEAIEELAERKILSGKSEKMFCPNDYITREEFVKILVETFNFSHTNNSLAFEDVDNNAWYINYVKAAYQNGIVKGYNDIEFGIGDTISRQDIAVMVMNVINKKNILLQEINMNTEFADSVSVSDYAKEAVEAMQKFGIINGTENNCFLPGEKATRAQAAVIIYNLIKTANL